VFVGVAVYKPVAAPAAQAPRKHRGPDADHEQAGDERQPRVQALGHDEPRKQERDEAEPEHARRVGHGHGRAEQHRVAGTPPRADQVARDQRLPVPWRERVGGAPEGRNQKGDDDDAEREVTALDQGLEAAAAVTRRRGCVDAWRETRARAQRHRRGRRGHVERRAEQVLRIGAELIACARGRDARRRESRAVARGQRHLPPADPPLEVRVTEGEPRATSGSEEDRVQA
jgi:hypothetical protein